jgi:hypothetical protein
MRDSRIESNGSTANPVPPMDGGIVSLFHFWCRRPAATDAHRSAIIRFLLGLTLMVLFQGCQYDPYAHLFTTEKPQTSNVVGRYTLKDQTLTSGGLSALGGRSCLVVLAANGTFTATNVPPSVFGAPPTNFLGSLVTGSGTWRIDRVGGVDNGRGSVKTHWGIYLDSQATKMQPPGLTGNKPPYGLIYTLGDPDSGTVMIFERAK